MSHATKRRPYGYNEAALVEKSRVLKELAQLYPDVNRGGVNGI